MGLMEKPPCCPVKESKAAGGMRGKREGEPTAEKRSQALLRRLTRIKGAKGGVALGPVARVVRVGVA